jgi:predicted N-acetyltransferase YhbS
MPGNPFLNSIIPLQKSHELAGFDCGAAPLNEYLRKHAWENHQGRSARTYVAAKEQRVLGYYTIAASSVRKDEVSARVGKGLGNYPVPVFLLARLAVDQAEQGKGMGAGLLKDAIKRSARAAEIVGCRALAVQAKNVSAKTFYERFGFESSPRNELNLFLLMKDIIASVASELS